MNEQTSHSGFSPFLPVAIVAVSILLFLGWHLSGVVNQRTEGQRLEKQLNQQLLQAESAEQRLQFIVNDLVALAQTNARASALVTQLGISVNPSPAQPALRPPPPLARP
jgi:hypothetical protein